MAGVAADRRTKEEFGRVKLSTNQLRYHSLLRVKVFASEFPERYMMASMAMAW